MSCQRSSFFQLHPNHYEFFLTNSFLFVAAQSVGTSKHYSLVTSLHLEIAFSLQGSLANPQAKVVGINVRYGEPREVHPPCTRVNCHWGLENGNEYLELKTSVSFVDVSRPAVPAYSQPPALDAKLPYDFFYPFLPSSSSSYAKCSDVKCILVLNILCIALIKQL